MKSNIDITSNIYIRSPESLEFGSFDLMSDPEFTARVTGTKALRVIRKFYGESVELTELQKRELEESESCERGLTTERTHGIVKTSDGYDLVCRCEKIDCEYAGECGAKQPNRLAVVEEDEGFIRLGVKNVDLLFADIPEPEEPAEEAAEEAVELPEEFETELPEEPAEEIPEETAEELPEESAEEIPEEPAEERPEESAEEIPEETAEEIPEETAEELPEEPAEERPEEAAEELPEEPKAADNTVTLDELMEAIGCDNRLIINSADARVNAAICVRAIFLVSDSIDLANVLLLCKSRPAASLIKTLMEQEIKSGRLSESAREIDILTENAFLMRSRKKIYNYIIVDELQYMSGALLAELLRGCGFFLIGDLCMEQKLGKLFESYSQIGISGEHDILHLDSYRGDNIPEVTLLRESIESGEFDPKKEIDKLRNALSALSLEELPPLEQEQTAAILCQSYSEVERVIARLSDMKIPYSTIEKEPKARRELAEILWDFSGENITRPEFINRAVCRCGIQKEAAEIMFDEARKTACSDNANSFELTAFADGIAAGGFSEELEAESDANLYVSTFENAQGYTFDKVYVLENKTGIPNTVKAARMYYNAVSSAENGLALVRIDEDDKSFRQSAYGHIVKMRSNTSVASPVAILSDGRADPERFIEDGLAEAVQIQEYISENVHAGDKVSLITKWDRYEIIHNDVKIGETDEEFARAFVQSYCGQKLFTAAPRQVLNVKVKRVYAYASATVPSTPIYNHSRLWLAVEISGMGDLEA